MYWIVRLGCPWYEHMHLQNRETQCDMCVCVLPFPNSQAPIPTVPGRSLRSHIRPWTRTRAPQNCAVSMVDWATIETTRHWPQRWNRWPGRHPHLAHEEAADEMISTLDSVFPERHCPRPCKVFAHGPYPPMYDHMQPLDIAHSCAMAILRLRIASGQVQVHAWRGSTWPRMTLTRRHGPLAFSTAVTSCTRTSSGLTRTSMTWLSSTW